jgi:hypothetical protein
MKRYSFNETYDPISVTILERYINGADKGIRINSTEHIISDWSGRTDLARFKYNKIMPYFRRAISSFPESTSLNTIITADGLVGIFGSNFVNILDLFEPANDSLYVDIIPKDYDNISDITEYLNPLNKRVFIVNKNESYLETDNHLIYTSGADFFFESDMNYNLTTDNMYGYYKTDTNDWNNIYKTTSNFQFFKKQLFIIESDMSDLVLEYGGVDQVPDSTVGNKKFYYFRDLSISSGSEFIIFKFKSAAGTYGYITIY